jgi:asparaginyl-tRNA synthetase
MTFIMNNNAFDVRSILAGNAPKEAAITVKGWVRTRRDSKAGISFIHLSDGSSFHPVQVVAPNTLSNYADEVLKLTSGCAIEATGMVVPSPAKGQPFEMRERDQRDRLGGRSGYLSDPTKATLPRIST